LVNFYALQRAVSSDIDRELQTAVNLAARFIWVMFGTEQLNLLPPGFDIASLRNRLRRWAHELVAGPRVVAFDLFLESGDLCVDNQAFLVQLIFTRLGGYVAGLRCVGDSRFSTCLKQRQ